MTLVQLRKFENPNHVLVEFKSQTDAPSASV